MRYLILFIIFLTVLNGCERDKEMDTTGVVIEKKGCYPDSYLIQIVGGNMADRSFICPENTQISTNLNCTNAVFIHLPDELAIAGKRIRFVHTGNEISCLSSTGAPAHITVKSLRAD